MNLDNEFKQIGETSKEVKEVVYDLVKQKQEIEQKIHLFSVVSFTREMAESFNNAELTSNDISAISFRHYRDYETGKNNVAFYLSDTQGQEISPQDDMNDDFSQIWAQCMDILHSNGLTSVNDNFVNTDFKPNVWMSVSLLNNTTEDLLDLFLSKELKSIYEYNKLQNSVANSNEDVQKRLKI